MQIRTKNSNKQAKYKVKNMRSMKKIREKIQAKFFLRNKNYRFVIIKVKKKNQKNL